MGVSPCEFESRPGHKPLNESSAVFFLSFPSRCFEGVTPRFQHSFPSATKNVDIYFAQLFRYVTKIITFALNGEMRTYE